MKEKEVGKRDQNAPARVTCFMQYTECYVSIAFSFTDAVTFHFSKKKITLKSGGKACSVLVVC